MTLPFGPPAENVADAVLRHVEFGAREAAIFLSTFPLAKVAYTAILIVLVVLLLREVYSLWWDHTLYVGEFHYFNDGKTDEPQAKAFPAQILGQHQLLRSALIEENQRRETERINVPAAAEVFLPKGLPLVASWQSVLADVELKIQGFDIAKLLGSLRASVSPPDEVTGFVEKSGVVVRASVNWPRDRTKTGEPIRTPFETGQLADEPSAALAIAASIAWSQAADDDKEFAKIPREDFVAWTLAWWSYRAIRERKALGQLATDEDKKRWIQARRLLDSVIAQAVKYPEIWRLRADLIALALDGPVSADDERIAADDRRRYEKALGLPPLIAVAQEAIAATEKDERPGGVIRPGVAIWGRRAGAIGEFSFSVTATAVVELDQSGSRRLILPNYALADGGRTEYALTAAGPIVAAADASDIVATGPDSKEGVLLAHILPNFASSNALAKKVLAEVAPAPPDGGSAHLYTDRKVVEGKISGSVGMLALTSERITEPGDAGAPVLDDAGRLFAMGYAWTDKGSRLLTLKWVFDQRGLKLAP